MARKTRNQKDRTSLVISAVIHVLLIGGVGYWAWKSGKLQQAVEHILGVVRPAEKPKEQAKPLENKPPPKPLPKINEGAPPPPSGGSRRAVASDAPDAPGGESFFADTRTQVKGGASTGGPGSAKTNAPPPPPPPRPAVVLPAFRPAPVSSIKQLLAERAKSSSVVESFGSEQISKSGVSDASDIVGKISGSTVAEGKFAVVRGLADRYTLSTLNGVDIPSADPNRRAAQLDLFPAQFIDRVDVSKTFQPDMPGGFAGGLVNIVTRSFPERPLFSFSAGTSYNTQSSLRKDFLKSDQGSTDWLAIDDGTRQLPDAAAATSASSGTTAQLNPAIKNSFGSRQFTGIPGDSPLNSSMSLAFGDTTTLLGRRFGFLAGLNYKNDYQHYSNGRVIKYKPRAGGTDDDTTDVRSIVEYSWGSLATLAYEVSRNHELNFNFMAVQTAEDESRRLQGQNATLSTEPGISYVDKSSLHWTERSLTYFQLKGKHEFPELRDIRFDWVGSLSSTTQDEPDHRIFQFFAQPGDPNDPTDDFYGPDGPSQPSRPTRIFRSLEENNMSLRADLTIPLSPYNWKERTLKTGVFTSRSKQTYDSRVFDVRGAGNHPFNTSGDPNSYLAASNSAFISYYNFPANFKYDGEQTINAAYLMGTWQPLDRLRLVGGVRYETTDISVNTVNLSKGGERFPANIQQNDLLPALSATLSLRSNLQFRAAWSQTIVRPTYREISRAELYDVAQGRTIRGNPGLKMSSSENFDLRLEWFPRPGELISIGAFKKKIKLPIEQAAEDVDSDFIFYNNYDKADVMGVEVELRKNLGTLWSSLDEFTMGVSYAYIKSKVPRTREQLINQNIYVGNSTPNRPLYDQPAFIVNGDLSWDHPASGTSININGGVVGRRLVLVGLGSPDEYEDPAPQLDIGISQKLGRYWKVKFSAKNLLDPVYQVSQDFVVGTRPIKSYKKGMTFGLSAGFDF